MELIFALLESVVMLFTGRRPERPRPRIWRGD